MTNGNEPAFSKAAFYHPDGGIDSPQEGLTKREYFAAMAMQGMLANTTTQYLTLPSYAVQMADALIEQLNQKTDETDKA